VPPEKTRLRRSIHPTIPPMHSPFFHRCLRAVTALGVAAGLTSCLDLEQNLVLNPDGSGRVTMATAVAMPNFPDFEGLGEQPGKKLKPREQARELAVALLRAEGIEAWSDVTHGVGKDGRTRASVTGYFPDVTKVRLSNPMDAGAEKDDLGVTKDADGNWVVEETLGGDEKKKTDEAKPGDKPAAEGSGDPAALTDAEIQDKIDEERQQWAAMKGFMGAFFDTLRIAQTVQGGGSVVESSIYEKKDDRTVALEFTGKKLIESVEALLQDDDRVKALIRKGVSPTDTEGGPEEFFKMMFGGDGKIRVVLKPGEPAFDYAAAVAKARTDQSPELLSLLEDAKKPPRPGALPGLSLPGLGEGEDEADGIPPGDVTDEEMEATEREAPPARKPRRID